MKASSVHIRICLFWVSFWQTEAALQEFIKIASKGFAFIFHCNYNGNLLKISVSYSRGC